MVEETDKLKEEALALRKMIEKEFAEAIQTGETVESVVAKVIRRPAGRSTSFLNISKEPDSYVAAKGVDIVIDEDGNQKLDFY